MTAAMSSMATRTFMGPTCTSTASSGNLRVILPARPSDFSCTVSPSLTCCTRCGCGVRVVAISSGGVRHNRLVELLAKFAARLGNAALGLAAQLERFGAILNGVDRFARMILEVAQTGSPACVPVRGLFRAAPSALRFPDAGARRQLPARARPAAPARHPSPADRGAGGRGNGRHPASGC